MKSILLLIMLAQGAVLGASYQPWNVRIVYPPAPPPPQRVVSKLRQVRQVKPKKPAKVIVEQRRVVVPFSFVSGSVEKPETDEFKKWKDEQENTEESKRKRRMDQMEKATRLLVRILDGLPVGLPPEPSSQENE